MFLPDDTIVAIATPAGRGGIGVVRISGARAREIASRLLLRDRPLQPRHATFTKVRGGGDEASGPAMDDVIATWFPAPHSYTGEHIVEVSTHGSPVILGAVLRSAVDAGARLAQPGEFTFRAFLNGKIDLIQAEAVADLVDAVTPLQARVAFDQLEGTLTDRIRVVDAQLLGLVARLEASLDFPDEGYHFIDPDVIAREVAGIVEKLDALLGTATRGRLIREGVTVVIAGRPNVGKSSLFNALLGQARAIVTDAPGTTRDLVTETCDLDGLKVTLVDTAGLRESADPAEHEGVVRGTRAREVADLVVVVLDGSEPLTAADDVMLGSPTKTARLIVANKSDRAAAWTRRDALSVSAATGGGVEALRQAMSAALGGGEALRDCAGVSNVRHAVLLARARTSLESARTAACEMRATEEFVLADLRVARECCAEVVGAHTSEDVLQHIFERFCIGK
jgi:tRNA modification GTPase